MTHQAKVAMAARGPSYFDDFESVFNDCAPLGHADIVWANYAAQLEQGLSVYMQCTNAVPFTDSDELKLTGGPERYNEGIGDHGAAVAAISKLLDMHEAQTLLLLKRWVSSTQTQVFAGWVPSDAQVESLRCLYASQRWHHLLCMRCIADGAAAQNTAHDGALADRGNEGTEVTPVSTEGMLIALLQEISSAMDHRTAAQLLNNDEPGRGEGMSEGLNISCVARGSSDQAVCELCLMLHIALCLLSCTSIDLGAVLESVKRISTGIANTGIAAWHDHAGVHGLVPRYAVAVIMHLLRCRDTVEALESPEPFLRSSDAHVCALKKLARHFLKGPVSQAPALGPCMLACAAQLLAQSNISAADEQMYGNLLLMAEACTPIAATKQLLVHEMLKTERPGVFAESVLYSIGLWCLAFSLRPSTMAEKDLHEFLGAMSELMHHSDGLAMKAWSERPGTRFIKDLIQDGMALFPVFPIAYASLLASLCNDRDSRACAWQALQELGSFTTYLDEVTQQALEISKSSVTIRDHGCEVLQRVVLQIAHVSEPGNVVPMPQIADKLNVGNGCLVRWSLQGADQAGLGFVLMIEEVIDRSEKLQNVLSQHGDLTVLEHIVHTLAACSSLLARLLTRDPWRILDLLHRRIHGAQVAGYALCNAAHNTLSVIGRSSSVLVARCRARTSLLGMLAVTAGNCLDIFTSVSLVLPTAVLELLLAAHDVDLGISPPGPIWLVSVLEGVHQLETAWGTYPAALAGVKLVGSLIKCIGLTEDLFAVAMQVISGMGCYHTQWHLKESARSWDMTIAILTMLYGALGCSSLQDCRNADHAIHVRLLRSLLQDGLLIRLFWANIPQHNVVRQAAELFSTLPDKQTHAARVGMQCVVGAVHVALGDEHGLVPALFQFLLSQQVSGWSVAATLSSYSKAIQAQDDDYCGVPLQFISSLMLLVRRVRDLATDMVPSPSFVSLMHLPWEGSSPDQRSRSILRAVLVAPLALARCLEDRQTAAAAAVAVETCIRDHTPCVHLLLDLPQLSQDWKVDFEDRSAKDPRAGIEHDSLLEVLWASLEDIAKPGFFTSNEDAFGCVLPILQVLSAIVGSGDLAGTALTSRTGFWGHLEAVWLAITADLMGSRTDARLGSAACIVDIVTFALHQGWNQNIRSSESGGELSRTGTETDRAFRNLDGDRAISLHSVDVPAALMTLLEKLCNGVNQPGSCLYDCLEHLGSKNLQDQLEQGEDALIRAAQTAALLVSTFLDSMIPTELNPHALSLWQELNACFSDLRSLHHVALSDMNMIKGTLLQAFLGIQTAPYDGQNELHDFESQLRDSCCHTPILARLHDPARGGPETCLVDPHRWMLLAEDLNMLEPCSDTFHYDACQRIFVLLQNALAPTRTAAAVTDLLRSYSEMLTVALSHAEGVQVAKQLLGTSMQLKLMQQATTSWDLCTACSVSDFQRHAAPHRMSPDSEYKARQLQDSPQNNQNCWLPVKMTAWGKVQVHLDLATSLVNLANLAVMSEQTPGTRSAGHSRLRREPSFAQLAGAHRPAMAGNLSPDQALRGVLNACKDALLHIGSLRSRINSNKCQMAPGLRDMLDITLASFLQIVLEAMSLRQGAIMNALRSLQSSSDSFSRGDIYDCILDAIQALCSFALRDTNHESARAMSILVTLAFTIGCADQASPQATSADLLSAVPFHKVLAAATQSVAVAFGAEALHGDLARPQYPAAALALVQQLAICSSVCNTSPSRDTFLQLLRFHAALDNFQQHRPSLQAIPPLTNIHQRRLENPLLDTNYGFHKSPKLMTPGVEAVATGPRVAVVTAHQFSTQGLTLRLGGHVLQPAGRRITLHQAAIPGYSSSGSRLLCTIMQGQVNKVLALLLSIPKPPEPVLVTVLMSQQAHLHQHVHTFCDLLYAEPAGDAFMLTRALIDNLLSCLDLWYVLGSHKGLLILSAPTAVMQLQQALCRVLDTIASLPTEQSAVARLSTAPVDPAEAKLAEEPTTVASEALLGLQHFWFWVCSVCKSGACSVDAINMPAWARKSSSKTPRQGSKHVTSSPEYLRGTAASRSYSPNRVQRDSLSPRPLSPPPGPSSRSPSASPGTSLVPHTSFVSGAIPIHSEDVESTRHSEQLAIGVYQIARAAVRLLSRLEPQRESGEIDTEPRSGWLSLNTALSLQRQCFELSRHLDRNQGDRSVDDAARRKMQDGLVCSLVDVLDYTSQVVQERSQPHIDSAKKSILPSGHWRHVNTSRTILCRLIDN